MLSYTRKNKLTALSKSTGQIFKCLSMRKIKRLVNNLSKPVSRAKIFQKIFQENLSHPFLLKIQNRLDKDLIAEQYGNKELSIIEKAAGNSLQYVNIVPPIANAKLNGRTSTRMTAHLTIQVGHPLKQMEYIKHLQVLMRLLQILTLNLQLMILHSTLLKTRSLA